MTWAVKYACRIVGVESCGCGQWGCSLGANDSAGLSALTEVEGRAGRVEAVMSVGIRLNSYVSETLFNGLCADVMGRTKVSAHRGIQRLCR